MENAEIQRSGYQMRLFDKEPQYRMFYTNNDIEELFPEKIYKDIIFSETFRRLKSIRFLGAIDYLFTPNQRPGQRRHTRFDHVIGVAKLTREYCKRMRLSSEQETYSVVTALLHDIGHGPLSHSLEPTFEKFFQINHHTASKAIILSQRNKSKDIGQILKYHRVDPYQVVRILDRESNIVKSDFIFAPINVDTIEGVSRSFSYINNVCARPPAERVLDAAIAFVTSGAPSNTLDQFWETKNDVYNVLIQGLAGRWADALAQRQMEDDITNFSENDFFLSEEQFFRKHKKFLSVFAQARRTLSDVPGWFPTSNSFQEARRSRSFSVHSEESFSALTPFNRYREQKRPKQLTFPDIRPNGNVVSSDYSRTPRGSKNERQLAFPFSEH